MIFPISAILCHAMLIHSLGLLVPVVFMLAIMNGYLFVSIPMFIEKIFGNYYCLESILFISNFEFCNFNLIRRIILFIAAINFSGYIPTKYFLLILTISIWITTALSIIGVILLKRKLPPEMKTAYQG